jgi:hypothetical protein
MLVGGAFALAGDVVVQPTGASGGQQQPAGVMTFRVIVLPPRETPREQRPRRAFIEVVNRLEPIAERVNAATGLRVKLRFLIVVDDPPGPNLPRVSDRRRTGTSNHCLWLLLIADARNTDELHHGLGEAARTTSKP